MAGLSARRAEWEVLRELPFASLSGTYMSIGSSFSEPIRTLLLQNSTDATLYISFDGINDHWALVPNSQLIVDINSTEMERGSQVYAKIKVGTPTEGDVYVGALATNAGV